MGVSTNDNANENIKSSQLSNSKGVNFAQSHQIQQVRNIPSSSNAEETMVSGSPPKSPRSPKSPRKNNKTRNWWFRHYRVKECSAKSKRGQRQARRLENWNYLVELGENEELGDLEIVDLAEPTISVFAELLMEQDKMQVWNDFVNHTEDDQEKMLEGFLYPEESEDEDEDEVNVSMETEKNGDLSNGWEIINDERKVHPAFSAEQCFKRIDSGLRNLLKKKHIPMGALAHLEDELTSFFKEWPTSVFISRLPSSFERLLMHALCQYLDLHSKSFNDDKGVRQTQVENKQHCFTPPGTALSQFLETKHWH